MGGCLKLAIRSIFFVSYLALIIGVIVLIILLLNKVREYTALSDEFNRVNAQLLEKETSNQDLTTQLNAKSAESRRSEQKLKDLENALGEQGREGLGQISGRISGQLLTDSPISQYQFVCAQNVQNTNLQYCLSVSSITQNYSIILPAGTYKVFAKATNNNSIVLNDYSGIYSQYIKCLGEKPQNECDETKLQNEATVEVKPGSKIEGINPIDWQKIIK